MSNYNKCKSANPHGSAGFRIYFDTIEDSVIKFELLPNANGGLIRDVNKATIERLGYSREELLLMNINDLEKTLTSYSEPYMQEPSSGAAALYEAVHTAKDGRDIPVEISARRFEHEGKTYVLEICRDITTRKKVDKIQDDYLSWLELEIERKASDLKKVSTCLKEQTEELRLAETKAHEAEKSLQALIDVSHQSIFMVDPVGRLLYVNKTIAQDLGSTPEKMIGTNVYDYLPEDLAQARKVRLAEAIESRKPVKVKDYRDGKPIFHIIYPIIENDRVNRVAIYAEDLTEIFSKERELARSRHIRAILFEVMEHSQNAENLEDLLESIHKLMLNELKAENFFVALIDEEREELRSKYCIDKKAENCAHITNINAPSNRALALLPIRNNSVIHLLKSEIEKMMKNNQVEVHGEIPEAWLGVPLRVRGKPIGTLVIQDYDSSDGYSDEDIQLFSACSEQMAIAIERQKFDQLSESGRDIFNNIPAGMLIFRFNDHGSLALVDANPAAEKIFGISREHSFGLDIREIWKASPDRDLLEKIISPINSDCDCYTDEVPYPSGKKEHLFRIRSFSLPDNRLGITFEDITDQKHAQKAISESEEQFRALFEDNHTVMLIINPGSGRIRDANKAAQEMYGMSREKLCSKHIYELNTLTLDEIDKAMDKARERNQKTFIFQHCMSDGTIRDVEVFSGPFHFKGKTRLISIIHDITERLHNERELSKAKEEAIAANKSKDEFLANISHEIRTPLNGVMGMLQLLYRSRLEDEQKESVNIALQSSRNLLRVLDDILDLSKMEVGTLTLFEEPFILNGLMSECVNLFKYQAEQKGIELIHNISPETEGCYIGDEGRIRQILFNLLGNSLKFTEKGSVTLEVQTSPSVSNGHKELFFTVRDTGVGIPEDKIESIFESFTQVDGSLSRRYKGAGLGLSIVKRLIGLMGGEINVESRVNTGTTISFNLSLKTTDEIPWPEEHNSRTSSVRPLKILLVEDEKVNRMMATKMLENMGHQIICAENGQECLMQLKQTEVDIILMDIQMPVMDGIEATRIIRTSPEMKRFQDIPVIALSAHAHQSNVKMARNAGMNGYISKPFEWATLEKALEKASKC